MKRQKTVVFDVDGVLAGGTQSEVYSTKAGWAYEKCIPIPTGIDLLRELKARGYRIVLHTARWESDREKTARWMADNGVEYDELIMGKPSAEMYIDDKGYHFREELLASHQLRIIVPQLATNRCEKYNEE